VQAIKRTIPSTDDPDWTLDSPAGLAGHGYGTFHEILTAVETRIQRDYPVGERTAYGWNDKQTDRRKVVRLLRRTARTLPV
jgi:hypothetical protein